MSCGVGHRHGSDPALLWPWCRLAATALIQSLAWEPPYATGVAQEMAKRHTHKKNLGGRDHIIRINQHLINPGFPSTPLRESDLDYKANISRNSIFNEKRNQPSNLML